MKYIVAAFLFLAFPFSCFAQGADELVQALRAATTDSLTVSAYRELTNHYRYRDADSALYYANEGLAFARKRRYALGEGMMLNAIGEVNERHGLLDAARKHYLAARAVFGRCGFIGGVAATSNGLGVVAGKTSQYEAATRHFLEALKLYEQLGDRNGIVQTYIKLGVVNDHLGNLDQALSFYLKAERLNSPLPSTNASLTLLNNIGIIYGRKDDIKTALKYFHRGLKASDAEKSTGIHIALLGSMGIAHEKIGNNDSALHFQQLALIKARENHLPEEEARALVNLSSLYRESDPAISLDLLKQALAITERIQHLHLMSEVYESMIGLYSASNDYKQAFLLSTRRQSLKDTLFSLQKSKEIANLEAVHEVGRQESEIKTLAALNEKSVMQRDIMIGIALVAMALICIIWYFNSKVSNLNKELILRQDELKNSNTMKDKLFSILGHDLRAPLSRVIGLLRVLAANEKKPEESAIIEKLRQQSVNTLEVLDSLLLWGQSQLKGIRLNQRTIVVQAQIKNSLILAADHAAEKDVKLVDSTPGDLRVYADPSHFDFVMRNLLSNAVKFSHSGGAVFLTAYRAPGHQVVFTIRDSGVGIPPDLQNQIFSPGNESASGTWNEKGTGIGLMLCREYIAENGGKIWVESQPGKGTAFHFSLMEKPMAAKEPLARRRKASETEIISNGR